MVGVERTLGVHQRWVLVRVNETTAEYARRLVDDAPPFSPEQRDKLAVLLTTKDDDEAHSVSGWWDR